jgi:lipoic acid synthetase
MKIITPKPNWLKVKLPSGENYFSIKNRLQNKNLHTVCQSAKCPNINECWNNNTTTIMIMGNICTRDCAFCSIPHGIPNPINPNEINEILDIVSILNVSYLTITSVTRDDLPDLGSSYFAEVVRALKIKFPKLNIELLIPDFKGKTDLLDVVLAASPDVINHNIETPKEFYSSINRHPASYFHSLSILKHASARGFITKSGLMLGLGETTEQLKSLFFDLAACQTNILTIGQYLQPTKHQIRSSRYISPDDFSKIRLIALEYGFSNVIAGPFVRSSYQAEKLYWEYKINKSVFKSISATQ